jgi:hypothetical protein
MSARQFDVYGDVVPYPGRSDGGTTDGARARRRGRVAVGLFWLAVALIVLVRVVCFSTAQPSGFANIEGARKIEVR